MNSSSRCRGKPPASSSGVVDAKPQVLVRRVDGGFGRALQQHDLQVVVLVGGLADELRLGPRLAFEIQDLFAPVDDVDQRVALVVLRDFFARLRRDAEN